MNSFPYLIALHLFDGEVLGPLILGLGMFAIPIIGILTRHQRHMAEIIHGRRREDVLRSEFEGMKAEMTELRSQLRALNQHSAVGVGDTDELTRRLG